MNFSDEERYIRKPVEANVGQVIKDTFNSSVSNLVDFEVWRYYYADISRMEMRIRDTINFKMSRYRFL